MEQLLAAIRDETHFLRYAYTAAKSKSRPQWRPEPLPRPGIKPKHKRRVGTSDAEAAALWAHLQLMQPEP